MRRNGCAVTKVGTVLKREEKFCLNINTIFLSQPIQVHQQQVHQPAYWAMPYGSNPVQPGAPPMAPWAHPQVTYGGPFTLIQRHLLVWLALVMHLRIKINKR